MHAAPPEQLTANSSSKLHQENLRLRVPLYGEGRGVCIRHQLPGKGSLATPDHHRAVLQCLRFRWPKICPEESCMRTKSCCSLGSSQGRNGAPAVLLGLHFLQAAFCYACVLAQTAFWAIPAVRDSGVRLVCYFHFILPALQVSKRLLMIVLQPHRNNRQH